MSFYSTYEAPSTSPRQSRQGSMQVEIARLSQQPRSPSPSHAKSSYTSSSSSGVSKLNGSARSRPSKDLDVSSAAVADRAAKVRSKSSDSPTVKRKAVQRPADSLDPVPDLSTYSWQPNAPDSRQPPSHSNSAKVREPTQGPYPRIQLSQRSVPLHLQLKVRKYPGAAC